MLKGLINTPAFSHTEASRWSSSSRLCCALNALFSGLKLGLWKGRSFRIPEKPASRTSVNDIRYIVPKFWRLPYPVNVSQIPRCILSKSRVIRRYPSRPCALGCCSKSFFTRRRPMRKCFPVGCPPS